MRPLEGFPAADRAAIRAVFTDIDDTLTTDGRLPAAAYAALERLQQAGLAVVPITGRPAGWCDLIARFWPVDAVVGENGAFWYRYDHAERRMIRRYWKTAAERAADRARLAVLRDRILAEVPGAAVAADQAFREADLAIDFREDVPPLPQAAVDRIVALFHEAGAVAKVSSIHVNGWFGDWDKLAMTRSLAAEVFGWDIDRDAARFAFVGDSPNDAPMFGHFPHSIGVANVADFQGRLSAEPQWLATGRGAAGFTQAAEVLIAAREAVGRPHPATAPSSSS